MENIFNQSPFQCRMDWGLRGVDEAVKRGDIIIIIDILSFSTAVVSAVHYGAIIYPFPKTGDAEALGKLVDAEVILGRKEAKELGKPSQSPTSYNDSFKGKKYVMCTTNGGECSKIAKKVPALLIGSFLNASAVANVANQIKKEKNLNISVIACGEKWSKKADEETILRPSIEDYLGAGAILSLLEGTKSPEAEVCIASFESCKLELDRLLWDCSSGRELRSMGVEEDLIYSSKIDMYAEAPILVQDNLEQAYFKDYLS